MSKLVPCPIIGGKVVEVIGHQSTEIDWQALKAIPAEQRLRDYRAKKPTKQVWHLSEIVVETPDGKRITLEPDSYYDSVFIECPA